MKAIIYIFCSMHGEIKTITVPIASCQNNYTIVKLLELYEPEKLVGVYRDAFEKLQDTKGYSFSNWHVINN